jgi:hypothetical protein
MAKKKAVTKNKRKVKVDVETPGSSDTKFRHGHVVESSAETIIDLPITSNTTSAKVISEKITMTPEQVLAQDLSDIREQCEIDMAALNKWHEAGIADIEDYAKADIAKDDSWTKQRSLLDASNRRFYEENPGHTDIAIACVNGPITLTNSYHVIQSYDKPGDMIAGFREGDVIETEHDLDTAVGMRAYLSEQPQPNFILESWRKLC